MSDLSKEEQFQQWFNENNMGNDAWEDLKKAHEQILELKETREERVIERAYLIENNTFEERCSEASHYNYLDDTNSLLERKIEVLTEGIKSALAQKGQCYGMEKEAHIFRERRILSFLDEALEKAEELEQEVEEINKKRITEVLNFLIQDLEFLLKFAPSTKAVEGLDPTFYHTGNYLGDVMLDNRLDAIRERVKDYKK